MLESLMSGELADTLSRGGVVVTVLIVLSVVVLAIVLRKVLQFSRLRVWRGNAGKAEPVALVVRSGQEILRCSPNREDLCREEMECVARQQIDRLESGLGIIGAIAVLSPLLGLLGTVMGMIEAFQRLEGAGSRVDPAVLSGGIWEALLTTAAGLIVAIPATALHAWLKSVIKRNTRAMEDSATALLTRRQPAADIDDIGFVAAQAAE
ncbi:MotA/TolQ/ExbB proton channel family protein [Aestuariispira ectoiniformans]|uniref:MotA/TolQ/ExbB proton channel family protein n=1 Tax=Aestuariispira ectoiniformans TaxID=2775080 RepID=UPI00223AE6C6|nr:MotA/TolQ/ExbB proton channel family protein [Aestuariispira ectoiniformans]